MSRKAHKNVKTAKVTTATTITKEPTMATTAPATTTPAPVSAAAKLMAVAQREDNFRGMIHTLSQRLGRDLKLVGVKGTYALVDTATGTTQRLGGYTHAESTLAAMLWLEQLD